MLPFSLYVWVALFFTFIFASFALIFVKGFVIEDVFLLTFGIMITQVNLLVIIAKGFTFFFSVITKIPYLHVLERLFFEY